MTIGGGAALTNPRRLMPGLAVLFALLALAGLLGMAIQGCRRARAIAAPQVFAVVQTPGAPANVQPDGPVSFAVDFTANAGQPVSASLVIQGDLGPSLTITSFSGGLGPTNCTVGDATGQTFNCNLGSLGAGSTIQTITVNAKVRNVPDGTSIDLTTAAFVAKDGPADGGVTVSVDNAPALTVQNENVAITNVASISPVFEGGQTTYTVGLTNNGAAASGTYTVTVTLAGGTVISGGTCPGGVVQAGAGTSTATCPDLASLAPAGSASVTVVARANDNPPSGVMTSSVAVTPGSANTTTGTPAGIQTTNPGPTNTTATELTLTGNATVVAGTLVDVCTTNSGGGLVGYVSGINPLTTADYILTPSGGASASALAAGTCPGQQGIQFTSVAAGTVAVQAGYNAIGRSNTVSVTFTSAGPTSTPTPTATPSPTATSTSTPTPTPTGVPTQTPTPTQTLTPTPTTTPGASPTPSTQLVVVIPAAGVNVARSRLSFSTTTGSLVPSSVSFVIKRKSDNRYWNGASGAWESGLVENAATNASGTWTFAVTGASRRLFVNTKVIVEARAVVSGQNYSSTVTPEITVR